MQNDDKKYWFIAKKDDSTAEIFLYGEIGTWGDVKAADFAKDFKELEKSYATINMRVNSVGGSVWDGLGIYNTIKNSKSTVDAYVDGIAASMASVIIMACRKIYMSKMARLMTHKPSGGAYGTADELRKTADELDACDRILTSCYAARVGCSQEDATKRFMNGTDMWFSAEKAMQEKLIDGIYDDDDATEIKASVTEPKEMWELYRTHIAAKHSNQSDTLIIL